MSLSQSPSPSFSDSDPLTDSLPGPSPDALARRSVVFIPAEAPRAGRFAFWSPDDPTPALAPSPALTGSPSAEPDDQLTVLVEGAAEHGAGDKEGQGDDEEVRPLVVSAVTLPVREALPVLARARFADDATPSAAFWGAATLFALDLVARGLLLPGLTAGDLDAWRVGPLGADEVAALRDLAASMPPSAHAVPLPERAEDGGFLLPEPERLLRTFADAVADVLPRTPAAPLAAGGPAFAADEHHAPRPLPEHRPWAADVAAGHDAGVRLSLRIELVPAHGGDDRTPAPELPTTGSPTTGYPASGPHGAGSHGAASPTLGSPSGDDLAAPTFRAVLQLHAVADPTLVADAAAVWSGTAPGAPGDAPGGGTAHGPATAFGPRARMDALLALRRAARAWSALTPLLTAAVPDAVDLADEEVAELLGPAARALAATGVPVHWPRELAHRLTAHAVIGPRDTPDGPDSPDAPGTHDGSRDRGDALPSFLSADTLLAFNWRYAIGDQELTRAELDLLAEAGRPLVRLRDQWVLVDPEELRRNRAQQDRVLTPLDALGAALTGTAEVDGRAVEVRATGWLEQLRARLADPERTEGAEGTEDPSAPRSERSAKKQPVPQPAALAATLRDYQLRGLRWLDRMTSLGLGACLADDMGLGKTITLIALHLHRQSDPSTAGPTLVVCPTSLMGNWQREIERFAPGTPVRRFHGAARGLDALADGEVVLTTYGTMRLDASRLAAVTWGLVVADEAQHVKNPYAATARALRAVCVKARARVALTGTPVENNLSELWAILDWTTPGLLGGLGAFRTRYASAVEGGGDPAAASRLAALVGPFLLRRRKSDPGIAPELPPKTETDRAVSLTKEQAGLYEAVVRETLAAIAEADGMERRGLVVKLLTGLKQICNHPAQYLKENKPRIEGRSGKLELLDELLDTILAERASVLVFTQYVGMARLLERHLAARGVATQFLHGGTPVAERESMVARFQAGEVPVFLLSLKAAGTGLNLTRAEHVVHYDRWWNPAVEAQATDRAYRIGQTRPVQVHRLIAEGTVEDRIAAMLDRKRALADAVLGGAGEAALTELTDAELAELVGLRRTEETA